MYSFSKRHEVECIRRGKFSTSFKDPKNTDSFITDFGSILLHFNCFCNAAFHGFTSDGKKLYLLINLEVTDPL